MLRPYKMTDRSYNGNFTRSYANMRRCLSGASASRSPDTIQ